MQARMFCSKHGKLSLGDVVIKNGLPVCRKCQAVLEFGKVRPRRVEAAAKKKKKRRKKK